MSAPLAPGKAWLALGFALLCLAGLCYGLYAAGLQQTGGTFTYPLDDAYIHLALARNLSMHGVWGVRPDAFCSVSSSILWPLHLAALMLLTGPEEYLPLLLNGIYGCALLVLAWQLLRRRATGVLGLSWPLLLLILVPSLPLLIFFGMEHTLHAMLALGFAWAAAEYLEQSAATSWQNVGLLVLAALLTGVRYEGMLQVCLAAAVALWQRRWAMAVLLPLAGLLPLVAFGLYSLAQDAHWMPNPILVKSDVQHIQTIEDFELLLERKLRMLQVAALVTVSVLLGFLGLAADRMWTRRLRPADRLFVSGCLLTVLGHLSLSRIGWYGRYECYLLVLLMVANGVVWQGQLTTVLRQGWLVRVGALVTTVVLLYLIRPVFLTRFVSYTVNLPTASRNIHEQQIQMARFVRRHYNDQSIIINDLGAIAWYTDARMLDMAGLATDEVAQAIIRKEFNSARLTQLARQHGARVAIVYVQDYYMPAPRPPAGWIEVGTWTLQDNVASGDPTLHFFGLDRQAAQRLADALREFQPALPSTVIQQGEYLQPH